MTSKSWAVLIYKGHLLCFQRPSKIQFTFLLFEGGGYGGTPVGPASSPSVRIFVSVAYQRRISFVLHTHPLVGVDLRFGGYDLTPTF